MPSPFIRTIEDKARSVAAAFVTDYGVAERFLAAHPKTSLLIALGVVIVANLAGAILHI